MVRSSNRGGCWKHSSKWKARWCHDVAPKRKIKNISWKEQLDAQCTVHNYSMPWRSCSLGPWPLSLGSWVYDFTGNKSSSTAWPRNALLSQATTVRDNEMALASLDSVLQSRIVTKKKCTDYKYKYKCQKKHLKTREPWLVWHHVSRSSYQWNLLQIRYAEEAPESRLTSLHFIANSLLLCLFRTSFYSGSQGWGSPFYRSIYGALGGHPATFYIGKPVLQL